MNTPEAFEAVACEAAREGGKVLKRRFRERDPLKIQLKGLHDFVTEVDHEAEDAVLSCIRKHYPDHTIMSEEASPEAQAAAYRWIVDPLDGTTNFIHGVGTFSVSVAVEDEQGLAGAAIHDPFHDETFHAQRGGGAKLDGEPIRCSTPDGPDQALIATGFPFRELSRLPTYLEVFEACIRSTAGIRRAGSAAIDLALTACGRYDGFFEIGLSRWDIAAGILLVREAGGIVTDVVGGDSSLDSGDIIAAGPQMHATLLKINQAAFGKR
ncbi:MAG: inositol monophosphatase [bacterium]|nr:inositol monophosphatase [bacterium]